MAEDTCGPDIHIKNCGGSLGKEQVGLCYGLNSVSPPPIYILKI